MKVPVALYPQQCLQLSDIFSISHSGDCIDISGFNLQLSDDDVLEYLFMYLLVICLSFVSKHLSGAYSGLGPMVGLGLKRWKRHSPGLLYTVVKKPLANAGDRAGLVPGPGRPHMLRSN